MLKTYLLAAAFATGLLASQSAWAGDKWPASVVGTWGIQANQSSLTVVVNAQSTLGRCHQITGSLTDNGSGEVDSILGYYCPNSGRIHFTRTNSAGLTFQDYSGNVSDNGRPTYVGGTFSEVYSTSLVGEYSFFGAN